MQVEKVEVISLDKKVAQNYAVEIAKEEIGGEVKKVDYLGGGSFGRAFRIKFSDGRKIVLKFLIAQNMLEKEIFDLELLAKHCAVKFPAVLFSRKSDGRIPVDCYGMEYIEGKSALLTFGLYFASKKKKLKFADKVTSAIHSLHECKNNKFGDTMNPDCEDWIDCYKPFAKSILDKAEEMFAQNSLLEKIIVAMRKAWDKFDVIFSEKVTEACLIHGDLNTANIMVDKKGNITGFIDPLNSMYADREYDLFQFDNLMGKKFYLRKTYIEKYGASKYCDQKCAFYALWNEVYCYIKSGTIVQFIIDPLVANMHKTLAIFSE
ncbi:MAG: aminoglycoside phosphotransferase family protein [Clostridia bacterium]|nr:aminoglycoside phosphotransferase family protein [Clostridia bacterium]